MEEYIRAATAANGARKAAQPQAAKAAEAARKAAFETLEKTYSGRLAAIEAAKEIEK